MLQIVSEYILQNFYDELFLKQNPAVTFNSTINISKGKYIHIYIYYPITPTLTRSVEIFP